MTRTCHDVIAAVAYHVSTLTRPRSSACPEYVVRGTGRRARDQSAMVSQLPVVPSAAIARTSTRTRLLPGVVASHVGISAVAAKPGVDQGDVQVPAS